MAWHSCLSYLTAPRALASIFPPIFFYRDYSLPEEDIFLMLQSFDCRYNSILATARLLITTMDEIAKPYSLSEFLTANKNKALSDVFPWVRLRTNGLRVLVTVLVSDNY